VPRAGLAAAQLAALLKELYDFFEEQEGQNFSGDLPEKEFKVLLEARSSARMIEARAGILRTILHWQRDVLLLVLEQDGPALHFPGEKDALARQAGLCTRAEALRRIAGAEEMGRRFERNLPAELVFGGFLTQMSG
jgi:hypothetical protein